jgi:DNA-binding NarL/FixJ family response regulator
MTRLFLVDDHVMVREGLRAVLEDAGHEVLGEASDLTSALAEITRLTPELVLLDLNLGNRSGLDLLQELRRRGMTVPVLVLTMSEQPRDMAQALRLGALGYVLKGADSVELLAAVNQVAAGRRHLGPGLADLAIRGLTAAESSADQLSARERQIVVLAVRGMSSAEVGEQLHLSPRTVDTYRSRAMAKLGLADLPALVRWAIREGLVGLDEK